MADASGRLPLRKESMTTTPPGISPSHRGRKEALPRAGDRVGQMSRLLQTTADASDVTVSIHLPSEHGTLLVALEGGNAFTGLAAPDDVCQYVADPDADGECDFIIGGQRTAIDGRYVLPVMTAIAVLAPWVAGADPLSESAWERQ
jgi:hypothetical protein